jgi:aspartyl-tRNA(Asn)/glutamyl-tRNA(Gln) amidotransferase subunit C
MAASVDRSEVVALARLARLDLSEGEIERMQVELATILAHVDALAQVDTVGVEPMTHAVTMTLRLRDDDAATPLSVAVALADAPAVRDDAFEVPAVLRGG